jgi:hypothetical protein
MGPRLLCLAAKLLEPTDHGDSQSARLGRQFVGGPRIPGRVARHWMGNRMVMAPIASLRGQTEYLRRTMRQEGLEYNGAECNVAIVMYLNEI